MKTRVRKARNGIYKLQIRRWGIWRTEDYGTCYSMTTRAIGIEKRYREAVSRSGIEKRYREAGSLRYVKLLTNNLTYKQKYDNRTNDI